MYNKQSCRECGSPLVPHSLCGICQEHSSWVCGRIEDYDHVNCRQQVVVAKS
jgi:hypothetical protein